MRRVVMCALLLALGSASSASAAPKNFYGMIAWTTPSTAEFKTMGAGGTQVFRAQLSWHFTEPSPGARDWSHFDEVVAGAAGGGMTVLPYLLNSPAYLTGDDAAPPVDTAQERDGWSAFVRDAVARYGPQGTFWQANPGVPYRPVRAWQVWNEPNFPAYWSDRPNPSEYATLLKLAHDAIKAQDPGAKVVLAGVADTRFPGSIRMTSFFRRLYRVPGVKANFDVVAIHPYAANHLGTLGAIKRVRSIMKKAGDGRTQVWLTEVGWATGGQVTKGTRRFKTTNKGQASRLRKTAKALLKVRRRYKVRMLVWFSWRDRAPFAGEPNWWAIHTGLFTQSGAPKPAWSVYKKLAGGS